MQIDLEILYLNSSSTKVMLNFLDLLEQARVVSTAAGLVPGAGLREVAAPAPHRE